MAAVLQRPKNPKEIYMPDEEFEGEGIGEDDMGAILAGDIDEGDDDADGLDLGA